MSESDRRDGQHLQQSICLSVQEMRAKIMEFASRASYQRIGLV